jgi:hypothetical protein
VTSDNAAFGVATFHSTHSVLKAEKIFKEAGLEMVRLIPVPSQVSSDCGVTVRFLIADLERARELMKSLEHDLEGIYSGAGKGWDIVYEAAG